MDFERFCTFDLMTMWSLDQSKRGKMLRKRLRSSEENNSHGIDIENKHTAYSKTGGLRLTKCRMKVKIVRNQAEIDVAKDINRNSKKTQPNKIQHEQNFRHQESEEVGLSCGEGRMEINAASLSLK